MPGTIESEILMQEENLTQAMRQMDINAFDRIFADDVMFTGVTGEVSGKVGLMTEVARGISERDAATAQGKKLVMSFDKEDIKVVTHGDTVVSSCRFSHRVQGEGIDIQRRYRTTTVWLKCGDRWQIIAGHTASLDPQGAR
jgi:ketosteroid isomerase-like protein